MKKFLIALTVLALILSLAACGGEQADSNTGNSPTTEQTPPTDKTGTSVSQEAKQTPELSNGGEQTPKLSLDDLSEEEQDIMFCAYAYCATLTDVLFSNGSEEQLAEVTSEEFIDELTFNYLYNSDIVGESGIDAVSSLLSSRVSDLISMLSTMDYDSFYAACEAGPEDFPYPGGWTAFYGEYLAFKEDAAAVIAVVDTAEEAFQAVEVSAPDCILYNENGVEVSFTGCTVESDRVNFNFHVSNQNPDNKKVSLYFSGVSVNGLIFSSGSASDRGLDGLVAGEEADMTCTRTVRALDNMLEKFGETVETMPIETLTFDYKLQIGSDSEAEQKHAELKTSLYHEGDIETFWGAYVGSVSIADQSVDIYTKNGEFGIVAVAVNTGSDERTSSFKTYVNGNKVSGLNESDNNISLKPGIGSIVFYTAKTDEEIRKEYEVGNSETLEITIKCGDTSTVLYSK